MSGILGPQAEREFLILFQKNGGRFSWDGTDAGAGSSGVSHGLGLLSFPMNRSCSDDNNWGDRCRGKRP